MEEHVTSWREWLDIFLGCFIVFPATMLLSVSLAIFPYEMWRRPMDAFGQAHPVLGNILGVLLSIAAIFVWLTASQVNRANRESEEARKKKLEGDLLEIVAQVKELDRILNEIKSKTQ